MKSVAIFCGARSGNDPIYIEETKKLGKILVQENIKLIYGGGKVGIMGAIADSVIENGGKAIGIIPKKLVEAEVAHEGLTELHIVETMHERKAMLAELADGFIALPGGIGTLEEWFEAFTWAQIGYHKKPCCLLNTNEYYSPMIHLFDHMIEQGFVKKEYKGLIVIESDPVKLINKLLNKY